MSKCGDIYNRGEFFQMLAGAHNPNINDMVSDRGYFGLNPVIIPVYGNVRTEDGEMYELLRNPGLDNNYSTLVIQDTTIDGKNLIFNSVVKGRATSAGSIGVIEGDEAVWRQAKAAEGKGFEIRINGDHIKWTEEDLFELEGPMIKPGLHWYLPARDEGTYYVSHMYELKGTYQGKKATGFVAFDQVYMADGGILYSDKDVMMENYGHIIWYTWATKYKDGTVDAGHFILGHDKLGFAVITDGENVIATQDINGVVTDDEENMPFSKEIKLTIDGVEWEFHRDPRGKMPAMLQKYPPTPQQEGYWTRVGETREVDTYWAWGETETKHGNTRMSKLPTRR